MIPSSKVFKLKDILDVTNNIEIYHFEIRFHLFSCHKQKNQQHKNLNDHTIIYHHDVQTYFIDLHIVDRIVNKIYDV